MKSKKYNKKLEICVLCCNKSLERNLEQIGEVTRDILSVLLINVNITLFKQPSICLGCSRRVNAIFEFKSACLYTEDFITPFVNTKEGNQIDLKEIYISEKGNEDLIDALHGLNLCRLCMSVVNDGFVYLDGNTKYVTDMIKRCIPEVNVNNTLDAVVCAVCIGRLEDYCNFMNTYSELDKKVKRYRREKGVGTNGRIILAEVLNFTNKKTSCKAKNLNSPSDSLVKLSIKEEDAKHSNKVDGYDANEEAENGAVERFRTEQSIAKLAPLPENPHPEPTSSDVCKTSALRQSDLKIFTCHLCDFEAKQKVHLKTHMLIHKDPSEIHWFKCNLCEYKGKQKALLRRHVMLMHADDSDVEWFKCRLCHFKAKLKQNLKSHMLKHKKPSEIEWLECNVCDFKAKRRHNLRKHIMAVHSASSEIEWFRCNMCDFKTKYKNSVKNHMSVHKDLSEVRSFKCNLCDFKTKHRTSLPGHMLVHKEPSEIKWYRCRLCDYKTKHKPGLTKHNNYMHKDALEVKWYECDLCDFKSKMKGSLTTHTILHKDPSDIKWFKCGVCDYKAKHNSNLKGHMLAHHSDPSKIQWFKCTVCRYKSKYRKGLKTHMLVHTKPSEIEWFRCDSCDFKAKRKHNLRVHRLLVHEPK